jgi:glyoxylase-like metal-dependent hydrolase (beta-lactamase superfamily II)
MQATDYYTVPAMLKTPFDQADADRGAISSQWFLAFQSFGLPVIFFNQSGAPSTFNQVAPGVHHIVGPSHHQLLIEQSDHLILVEAPLYEGRTAPVIDQIKMMFPGKPIKHAIMTHFHYDHVGAVRTVAAEGATIYAGAASQQFYMDVLANPKTVLPDRLSQNPPAMPSTVQAVSAQTDLTDANNHVVSIIPINTTHANDMVVVYLPAEKIMFTSDMYNPLSVPPGQPAFQGFGTIAGELYDEVIRLGVDVSGGFVGGHGAPGAAGTLADLKAQGSR